ncbi:CRP-like cAMP-binding protein [Afipia massiliensis]|uniref:CRP-like cAMP-binding protein n=1 Tax=Afipia massiliensis TaxID=211460 RepID=A0A840N7G7_9BRAD|nr:Crp/Fnr family transcriptional regulator [Afipia massiliensis]MBB5053701.1 CRP-like cAMP-binding protein [Afipia massiliensis]
MSGSSKETRIEIARSVLAHVPWFAHCRAETLDSFVSKGMIQRFRRDQAICRRGAKVAALSVVLTGTVEVSSVAPSGKRHILTYLSAGEIFNLVPIVDGQPCIHDASTHESSLLLTIPKGLFQAAVEANPALSKSVMRLLSMRTRALYHYVADNTLLPLHARCARLLLLLVEYHGMTGHDGHVINLRLSQERFAEMLGVARQSASRELRAMEKDGIIETGYSRFVINDVPALKRIAEHPDEH